MNPDTPQTPREELEVRLTALLMGELSETEAAEVRAQMAADPELAALHASLQQAVKLLREASVIQEPAPQPLPAQLSAERRQRLLTHFKSSPAPQLTVLPAPPRRDWKWVVPLGIAASLVAFIGSNFVVQSFHSSPETLYDFVAMDGDMPADEYAYRESRIANPSRRPVVALAAATDAAAPAITNSTSDRSYWSFKNDANGRAWREREGAKPDGTAVANSPVTEGVRSGALASNGNAIDALLFGLGDGTSSITTKSGQRANIQVPAPAAQPPTADSWFSQPGAIRPIPPPAAGPTSSATIASAGRAGGQILTVDPSGALGNIPQVVESEGFINYGSPIQTTPSEPLSTAGKVNLPPTSGKPTSADSKTDLAARYVDPSEPAAQQLQMLDGGIAPKGPSAPILDPSGRVTANKADGKDFGAINGLATGTIPLPNLPATPAPEPAVAGGDSVPAGNRPGAVASISGGFGGGGAGAPAKPENYAFYSDGLVRGEKPVAAKPVDVEAKFAEIAQNNLKELNSDWLQDQAGVKTANSQTPAQSARSAAAAESFSIARESKDRSAVAQVEDLTRMKAELDETKQIADTLMKQRDELAASVEAKDRTIQEGKSGFVRNGPSATGGRSFDWSGATTPVPAGPNTATAGGVPVLNDVPVLGQLFSRNPAPAAKPERPALTQGVEAGTGLGFGRAVQDAAPAAKSDYVSRGVIFENQGGIIQPYADSGLKGTNEYAGATNFGDVLPSEIKMKLAENAGRMSPPAGAPPLEADVKLQRGFITADEAALNGPVEAKPGQRAQQPAGGAETKGIKGESEVRFRGGVAASTTPRTLELFDTDVEMVAGQKAVGEVEELGKKLADTQAALEKTPEALHTLAKKRSMAGRTQFWSDDETTKLNINGTSEGTFWDKPAAAGVQPADREKAAGDFDEALVQRRSLAGATGIEGTDSRELRRKAEFDPPELPASFGTEGRPADRFGFPVTPTTPTVYDNSGPDILGRSLATTPAAASSPAADGRKDVDRQSTRNPALPALITTPQPEAAGEPVAKALDQLGEVKKLSKEGVTKLARREQLAQNNATADPKFGGNVAGAKQYSESARELLASDPALEPTDRMLGAVPAGAPAELDSSVTSQAATREISRRRDYKERGREALEAGKKAAAEEDFETAASQFKLAYTILPDAPNVRELRESAEAGLAEVTAKLNAPPPPAPTPPAVDAPPRKVEQPAPTPQPEVSTRENAFSTFSLNVADVAFKLAAASLEQGKMPELSTLRSEEFINALDYRDPEPCDGAPLAFASERARYPFAQNRDLLRLSVKTAAAGRQPGRALNIVLLLDNSGSMERADRVRIVRESLRVLATQLQPQDKLSIITFSRTPHLWIDGVAGDKAGEATGRVGEITPQGGTNISTALDLGYETALRHYQPGNINRVVLLTDGAANLGNVNPEALKTKVEKNRKQGIALDCFGIGWEGYDDNLLETLSRNGDGRYGFVNTPEQAATEFAGQLAGALRVAASDVKVQVEFNPRRVTAYRQLGYAKHQLKKEQFRDNTVDAAEIGAAESGNALYTVEINPRGEGDIAAVRVRFKVPGTSDYREQEWTVPYGAPAVPLDQASSAMRLAGTAGAFAEWLASSPYATEVNPDQLLGLINGVPAVYGADPRPGKLEAMIRQAKNVSGR
jgi:Mg-chelatase subunit ChlD